MPVEFQDLIAFTDFNLTLFLGGFFSVAPAESGVNKRPMDTIHIVQYMQAVLIQRSLKLYPQKRFFNWLSATLEDDLSSNTSWIMCQVMHGNSYIYLTVNQEL